MEQVTRSGPPGARPGQNVNYGENVLDLVWKHRGNAANSFAMLLQRFLGFIGLDWCSTGILDTFQGNPEPARGQHVNCVEKFWTWPKKHCVWKRCKLIVHARKFATVINGVVHDP